MQFPSLFILIFWPMGNQLYFDSDVHWNAMHCGTSIYPPPGSVTDLQMSQSCTLYGWQATHHIKVMLNYCWYRLSSQGGWSWNIKAMIYLYRALQLVWATSIFSANQHTIHCGVGTYYLSSTWRNWHTTNESIMLPPWLTGNAIHIDRA